MLCKVMRCDFILSVIYKHIIQTGSRLLVVLCCTNILNDKLFTSHTVWVVSSNIFKIKCHLFSNFWCHSGEIDRYPEWYVSFTKFFWRKSVLFMGPLIPLLWTSVHICLGFQSPLFACFITCNEYLRFTSGATPADLFAANMVAEPFWSTYMHISIGGTRVQDRACPCLTAKI